MRARKARMTVKRINLALQGGGAHGAFTWGALECLLSDPSDRDRGHFGHLGGGAECGGPEGGHGQNGRRGARDNLDWLWAQVGGAHGDALTKWLSPFGITPSLKPLKHLFLT